jgi:hypothetical protein
MFAAASMVAEARRKMRFTIHPVREREGVARTVRAQRYIDKCMLMHVDPSSPTPYGPRRLLPDIAVPPERRDPPVGLPREAVGRLPKMGVSLAISAM